MLNSAYAVNIARKQTCGEVLLTDNVILLPAGTATRVDRDIRVSTSTHSVNCTRWETHFTCTINYWQARLISLRIASSETKLMKRKLQKKRSALKISYNIWKYCLRSVLWHLLVTNVIIILYNLKWSTAAGPIFMYYASHNMIILIVTATQYLLESIHTRNRIQLNRYYTSLSLNRPSTNGLLRERQNSSKKLRSDSPKLKVLRRLKFTKHLLLCTHRPTCILCIFLFQFSSRRLQQFSDVSRAIVHF